MVLTPPGSNGGLAMSVQETINQRVDNLTRVLISVIHTSSSEAEHAQFIQGLQKIVCSATPTGEVIAKPFNEQSVQDLIDTASRLTGRTFTPNQQALLGAGVQALVQINESDANRKSLSLIKKNVDMFINNLQQSLDMEFSSDDRRSLIRGLVTLVGDGRTRPEVAITPPITASAPVATPITGTSANQASAPAAVANPGDDKPGGAAS